MASPPCHNDPARHDQLLPLLLHPPPPLQGRHPYDCFRFSPPLDLTYNSSGVCTNFEAVFKDAGFKDGYLSMSPSEDVAENGHEKWSDSSVSSFFMPSSTSDDDEEDASTSSSSSSTSSLSQLTQDDSSEQGGALHNLTSLAASLPIKRGLSRFFSGKSQSFPSLAQVSSVADLAKPENPFVKRRRMGDADGGHCLSGAGSDSLSPKYPSYAPPSRWAGSTGRPTSNRFRTSKPILLIREKAA